MQYLRELYGALSALGLGDRIIIDLGLVQRNDYYTGVVCSAYVEDYGDAVLIGGRYDRLLEAFDSPMPAIGFGINVDAVSKILLEKGMVNDLPTTEILVHSDDGYEMKALSYASQLTELGRRCENSVFESREQALAYAESRGIQRVDFVGGSIETVRL